MGTYEKGSAFFCGCGWVFETRIVWEFRSFPVSVRIQYRSYRLYRYSTTRRMLEVFGVFRENGEALKFDSKLRRCFQIGHRFRVTKTLHCQSLYYFKTVDTLCGQIKSGFKITIILLNISSWNKILAIDQDKHTITCILRWTYILKLRFNQQQCHFPIFSCTLFSSSVLMNKLL